MVAIDAVLIGGGRNQGRVAADGAGRAPADLRPGSLERRCEREGISPVQAREGCVAPIEELMPQIGAQPSGKRPWLQRRANIPGLDQPGAEPALQRVTVAERDQRNLVAAVVEPDPLIDQLRLRLEP